MKKVLLVDDETRILRFLILKLASSGFEIIPAESGPDAIDKALKTKPDLILMDIIMPGMDGVEALKIIRKSHKCPAVLFSARDHDPEDIRRLGADGYLRKPFDPEEAVALLHHYLNGHK